VIGQGSQSWNEENVVGKSKDVIKKLNVDVLVGTAASQKMTRKRQPSHAIRRRFIIAVDLAR
jgi:hypothetical protein